VVGDAHRNATQVLLHKIGFEYLYFDRALRDCPLFPWKAYEWGLGATLETESRLADPGWFGFAGQKKTPCFDWSHPIEQDAPVLVSKKKRGFNSIQV
jgi:hypothetical protein